MCYCKPEVRTPWCPNCTQVLYTEVKELKKKYVEGKKTLVYIASPYNHEDSEVTQDRMETVYAVASELMLQGKDVTTPLFMHEVVKRFELPSTFEYWEAYCFNILRRCDEMHVLCLPGWSESRGVKAEIEFCYKHCIPVKYVEV